jgi:hypothetical protein
VICVPKTMESESVSAKIGADRVACSYLVVYSLELILLTLTLLTWTKWRAPASTSKWRMGFNSVIKGLRL